jgi:hypothetical protein
VSPVAQLASHPFILQDVSALFSLPRGCLTEIIGPASSGRTSLLLSILAAATAREEICALVDAEDSFDPAPPPRPGCAWSACSGCVAATTPSTRSRRPTC